MKKIAIFLLLELLTATVFAAEFAVGFSRVDITPPLGTRMTGYFKERRVKTILDPLQINCVAFSDGVTKALVMQIDTLALCDSVATRMRDEIVKATGLDGGAVLLHASHTHDSGNLSDETDMTEIDKLYIAHCITRAADAATMAVADLRSARLSYARSTARRISFGRRYLMKDGRVRTNPGVNNPDIVRPIGNPPDDEVQVLRIDRISANPVCLINFQTHPDVVGGETVTADWPGLTRTVFERAMGGEVYCLVLNGTQGDVNHVNVQPRLGEHNDLVRDFDDVDRGYGHAKHMANVLAGSVLSVWMKCAPLVTGEIRYATENIRVPSQREKDPGKLMLARKYWDLHCAGRDAEIPFRGMELTTEVARSRRILQLQNGPDVFNLPVTAIAIGNSVAFCAFPGEPFNDIGKAVKKSSPFKLTLLSCLTNGSRGYFPFSDSYKQGGYESATSPFGPSVADDLIVGSSRLLNGLFK